MKYRRAWPLILFIILIGILVFVIQPSSGKNKILPARQSATVSRVVDGDTIKILIQEKEDTVRLIGIDAPETVSSQESAQCFGKNASNMAKETLMNKAIFIESDPTQGDRDEYGRLLRYVFLPDGTNFDEFMLKEGYAREYTFKGRLYKYRTEFIQSEKTAKKKGKGLWGSCEVEN
jgi:micrococcal nuclease